MKRSELKSYIKEQILGTLSEDMNSQAVKAVEADLVQSVENLYNVGQEEKNYRDVKDAAADAMKYIGDVFGIDFEFGRNFQEATITTADKYKDVKSQADKDEDIIVVDKSELQEDDDETDKAAAKGAKKAVGKSKRLDAKIKELKRIEADMKTELNAYKKAEGEDLKNAAKKQLKRLTALKKETQKEIDRLEREMV